MSTHALTLSQSPLHAILRALERDPRLKSAESRRGYRHDLAQFEAWRAARPLTKLLVEQYAAELQRKHMSPHSINRALASVRWWARKLIDLAHEDSRLSRDEREYLVTQAARVVEVADVTGTRQPKGRHMSPGELDALMRACAADDSPAGIRDAALIAFAWQTGARRSEIAGLQLAAYTPTGEHEGELIVSGKGDKTRKVYVDNGAAIALEDWLAIRGKDDGPLFYAINKGAAVQVGHGVSDEALAKLLAKRTAQAGIEARTTWHDFRRTFAGNLLDAGSDLVTVQKLMGHSSSTTTAGYDRRDEEVRRRAIRALHVPYRRRHA